ncbi:MAG: hypothetical protein JNM78_10155 [Cyclobacteriaceae bacterium]|nr:hypothetical protein [Cyclobacteriaceae bacterium]
MVKSKILATSIMMLLATKLFSQDQQIELALKGTIISSDLVYTEYNSYLGVGYSVDAHYFFNRKLAAGLFYTKSIFSEEISGGYLSSPQAYDGNYGAYDFLQYGLSGKITTSRERFFQIYATVKFFKMEAVYDFKDELGFSLADKGMGGAAGFGVVLRFSENVGFNLFDLNYNHYLTGFEVTKSNFSPSVFQVRSGLIINFLDRK